MILPADLRFADRPPRPLDAGWELASGPAGCPEPSALPGGLAWRPALVPGTVAESLEVDLERGADLDGQDWWYRCAFASPGSGRWRLRFEGLATLAEAWLNGRRLLASRSMFVPQAAEVTDRLGERNELVLCFRALAPELARRRPRPRWRSALVGHQNLRWIRTTLLGRIPGWTPAVPPVGPWRPIQLEPLGELELRQFDLQTRAEEGTGHLRLQAFVAHAPGAGPTAARLRVGDRQLAVALAPAPGGTRLEGGFAFPGIPLWHPHTHGEPNRLDVVLHLETPDGPRRVEAGKIGFKALELDRSGGRVQFRVNGREVFCRGACWTVQDFRSLGGSEAALRATLVQVRDAGFNLLRVGGTMVYESDAFYALCDELGILVWQDFMFANLDHPFGDDAFRAEAEAEAAFQLSRLQRHPCLAAYCGGSEVAQQAAMLGLPPEAWSGEFYDRTLPRLCAERHAGIPYFPSTPAGGALPFHTSEGLAHYYGVGAYRRPLEDARRARVKFAPECLAFSNVPDREGLELGFGGAPPPPHHPRWKARVPRDSGAGWDFEDIRDHYLQELFGEAPVALRSTDLERYLELSRAVTGEVMKAVFAEWRRPGSGCGGALVWFLKDLWPGAGWGLLDSEGRPKAAWWRLRRAFAARTVLVTDEGLEGIHLHVFNEAPEPLEAELELELLREGRDRVAFGARRLHLPPFGAETVSGESLMPAFMDLAYAYRFGPPKHDVALARLREADSGRLLGQDTHFPLGLGRPRLDRAGLSGTARAVEGGVRLELQAEAFLHGVQVDCPGFLPSDNAFDLPPGESTRLSLRPFREPAGPFRATVSALNLRERLTLRLPGAEGLSNESQPRRVSSALSPTG